jgi:hypothetical protein
LQDVSQRCHSCEPAGAPDCVSHHHLLLLTLFFFYACRMWVSGVTAANLQDAPDCVSHQYLLLLLTLPDCCLQDMGQRRHS